MPEQKEESKTPVAKIDQEQVHSILFNREIGWQDIIYDLINTEQLDPWDVNLTILSEKYLARIAQLEEADFFVSSKVLLAASLLLRIKSELLLNKYIRSIDDILFGVKEQKKYKAERIEFDEEIPTLMPRSPIPRFKKVTLKELLESLSKAIKTENRRIGREIVNRNALREVGISLPKKSTQSIKDKIKEIYQNLLDYLGKETQRNISFTEFIGSEKEKRILAFYPLLQLENQQKVWLHQDAHFEEIYIWLKRVYLKHNPDPFAELRDEIESELKDLEKDDDELRERAQEINAEFANPLGELLD